MSDRLHGETIHKETLPHRTEDHFMVELLPHLYHHRASSKTIQNMGVQAERFYDVFMANTFHKYDCIKWMVISRGSCLLYCYYQLIVEKKTPTDFEQSTANWPSCETCNVVVMTVS